MEHIHQATNKQQRINEKRKLFLTLLTVCDAHLVEYLYTAENLCWQRTISDYFYSIFLYTYLKCILLHKWIRSEWNYSCHTFQSYPDSGNRIDSNAILFHRPASMECIFWMTTSLYSDRFCGQLTTYYMARHSLISKYIF